MRFIFCYLRFWSVTPGKKRTCHWRAGLHCLFYVWV